MSSELLSILEYIERERGINRALLIKAIETAILSASRKSIHPASKLNIKVNPETGAIEAWATLEVVEANPTPDQLLFERAQERYPSVKIGDMVEWEVTPSNFGRIAAQTAKQAIMQQLRQAEKTTVIEEFSGRIGQIVSGVVRRYENGNTIIDFQRAEGIMSGRDKIAGEQYSAGDLINGVLMSVDVSGAGPSLVISRACPDFVKLLFEREVTEIHDGVVKIMGISREAGSRSKIAVASSDPRVDPVGACVGIRGARVRSITEELSGERIDIVPFNEDIKKFAINALLPAKVNSVDVNDVRHELIIHVSSEQSKLAFGKKAQNVRLSSRLLGWNISIVTEGGIEEKISKATAQLAETLDVSRGTADKLVRNGFVSPEGIQAAGEEAILSIQGINVKDIKMVFEKLNS